MLPDHSKYHIGGVKMKTSISRAVLLLTAFSVFTGLLLYPSAAPCTNILKDDQMKGLDPSEPDINLLSRAMILI